MSSVGQGRHRSRRRVLVRGWVLGVGGSALALVSLASACSSGDEEEPPVITLEEGGAGGATSDDVIFNDPPPNAAMRDGGAGGADPFTERGDPNCIQEITGAETIPVDIYIMFDQSGSMNIDNGTGTRLDQVRAAVVDFMNDPKSIGVGMGIGYFGFMPLGETSCDPADYSTPDVEIATLPSNVDAIVASLNAREPTGETPTGAALRGACAYSSAHNAQNPTRTAVNLLVTDGVPEAPISGEQLGLCTPTLEDAAAAAADCAGGDPGIVTYVLGVGPSLGNLNEIAAKGGTGAAYLVEGVDVTEQVLIALSEIRGDATIPCEFSIPSPPEGQQLDLSTVNVEFTNDDGEVVELSSVSSEGFCGAEGGWYYTENQTRIQFCQTTCDTVTGSNFGKVDYTLGCEPTRILR